MGSLSLRPCDSLTIPRMALSIDSTHFVSSMRAIQATGFLTFAPVGLMSPTEHASFIGRYSSAKINPLLRRLLYQAVFVVQPAEHRPFYHGVAGFEVIPEVLSPVGTVA